MALVLFLPPRPFRLASRPRPHARFVCSYSPTDLVNFTRSPFLTQLSLLSRQNRLPSHCTPDPPSRLSRSLIRAGLVHEQRVVDRLATLLQPTVPSPLHVARHDDLHHTLQLLHSQAPLVTNATLNHADFKGRPDILLNARYDPFGSGGEGYVVCEVKLGSLCSAEYALQSGAYVALLKQSGVKVADYVYLFLAHVDNQPVRLQSWTVLYLYQRVRRQFDQYVRNMSSHQIEQPGLLVDMREWQGVAQKCLADSDSLRLIAGIRRNQIEQLQQALAVNTVSEFADVGIDAVRKAAREHAWGESYERLWKQAKLQVRSRAGRSLAYEIIGGNIPEEGLRDIYFDLEGFPMMQGGLEYLWGIWDGHQFRFWWAHDREEEEKAFVEVVHILMRAWREGSRVYHYGSYEVSALRRVGSRATSVQGIEANLNLEQLLEGFVDVYSVVRKGLILGAENYSIKTVEKVAGVKRGGDVADAESSIGVYWEWRRTCYEDGQVDEEHPALQEILMYNKQDCESLQVVVQWLRDKLGTEVQLSDVSDEEDEEEQVEESETSEEPELEAGACGRTLELKKADSLAIRNSSALSQKVLHMSPLPLHVRTVLSNLLHYYVNESTPARTAFAHRLSAASEDPRHLFDDDQCVACVALQQREGLVYTYPSAQPCVLQDGGGVAFVAPGGELKFTSIITIQPGKVELKAQQELPTYGTLISTQDLKICDAPLRQAILRVTERLVENVNDERADLARRFLMREGLERDGQVPELEDAQEIADFVRKRKKGVLVVQGPPGSGKTRLGSEIIEEILNGGGCVAVSSNSHAAIDHLLTSVVKRGVDGEVVYKVGTRCKEKRVMFKGSVSDVRVGSVGTVSKRGKKCGALVGATCYQLGKEEVEGAFDVLVIDEASQVPVANFIAMSGCARFCILLGDQQQLEMPVKGRHNENVGVSCLGYLVGEEVCVEKERGVFLEKSYRMGKTICKFVSKAFYGGMLKVGDVCAENRVHVKEGGAVEKGEGIVFVSAEERTGKFGKWHCEGEVQVLKSVVEELVGCKCTINGEERKVELEDFLVVAPYNAQVRGLKESLPEGVRIGTVDKFQGQEGAIALISTCTSSSASEEEKGVAFALRMNRVNVAVSRAKCLVVVTGRRDVELSVRAMEDVRVVAMLEWLSRGGEL